MPLYIRKKLIFLLAIIVCSGSTLAWAGINVQVNKASNYSGNLGHIAVFPAVCGANIDCIWANKKFGELLLKYRQLSLVGYTQVTQAMMDLGIDTVDDIGRAALAKKLNVDTFMIIIIGPVGSRAGGSFILNNGNGFSVITDEIASGSVEVKILSASDGSLLLKGSGHGQSEWRGTNSVVAHTFVEICDKAFGRP